MNRPIYKKDWKFKLKKEEFERLHNLYPDALLKLDDIHVSIKDTESDGIVYFKCSYGMSHYVFSIYTINTIPVTTEFKQENDNMCKCEIYTLMSKGCLCGYIQKERACQTN